MDSILIIPQDFAACLNTGLLSNEIFSESTFFESALLSSSVGKSWIDLRILWISFWGEKLRGKRGWEPRWFWVSMSLRSQNEMKKCTISNPSLHHPLLFQDEIQWIHAASSEILLAEQEWVWWQRRSTPPSSSKDLFYKKMSLVKKNLEQTHRE